MKQATGDISASVLVVTAVALLTALFFSVIWPTIKYSFLEDSNCANAVCDIGFVTSGDHEGQAMCYNPPPRDDAAKKHYTKEIFYCPYRG